VAKTESTRSGSPTVLPVVQTCSPTLNADAILIDCRKELGHFEPCLTQMSTIRQEYSLKMAVCRLDYPVSLANIWSVVENGQWVKIETLGVRRAEGVLC